MLFDGVVYPPSRRKVFRSQSTAIREVLESSNTSLMKQLGHFFVFVALQCVSRPASQHRNEPLNLALGFEVHIWRN